jgi:SNF2 family DNA or RNA helicase
MAHTLIVLPRSLLDQWEQSIIKFCGYTPLVYHGSRPQNIKLSLVALKAASQIVITTYGQVSLPSLKQRNKGRRHSLLHFIEWDRVICDEAHHVSHPKTNEYKGVQMLQSRIWWLVTGTPIQNNEKELYTLYTLLGLSHSKTYYNNADNYKDVAKQLVYYSTKASVGLELPPLNEHKIHVAWENAAEEEFVWHIHSLLRFCQVPQKPLAVEIERAAAESDTLKTLRMKYMARAQQACVFPPMLHRTIYKFEELMEEYQAEQHQAEQQKQAYPAMDVAELYLSQSKINAVLKTLLERKANGCGKIVFCHYYAEIDAFAEQLAAADPTLRIATFDGRVPNAARDKILSTPVDILLAQIKMCREGLNLQANYSEVYLPSPHFNPAIEQQAIARCWRMGQQKPVEVFRYLQGGNPSAQQAPHPPSGASVEKDDLPSGASVEKDDLPSGVEGLSPLAGVPLTMDLYASHLHVKKQAFVTRMASSAYSSPQMLKIKIHKKVNKKSK